MKIKNTLLSIILLLMTAGAFAQNALNWQELGPKNMGGRTRAILIDRRDASRSTIYAGMVSGGLWKSTNHGASWSPVLSAYTSAAVSCIAQDMNGRIYFGTGEGLAQSSGSSRGGDGSAGNGLHFLYGNDQDSILPSTIPPYLSNYSTWSMINRIAVNPTNVNEIFVATSGSSTEGLMRSNDGGLTWTQIGSSTAPINGLTTGYAYAADVKFSADGNNVFASVGYAFGFPGVKLIVSTDGGGTFTYVNDSFPSSIWRIEIATAPSDPNVAYISIVTSNGMSINVFKTADAGVSWTNLTSAVLSNAFASGQGWHDNSISVYPQHSDRVYLGTSLLYTYSDLTGWRQASLANGTIADPQWVIPNMQTIAFNDLDTNEMYIGCEGGIFRSTNTSNAFPTPTYTVRNQGYNTTQMFSVAADLYSNVLGGSLNNGTSRTDVNLGSEVVYPGIGVYTEISHFDSSVFIGGDYGGQEQRSNDRGNSWNNMFDATIDPYAYGEPSVCSQNRGGGNAPFITAFWLAETKSAVNNVSKVPFTDNVSHSAGDAVTVVSHIGQPFQETLTGSLPAGDTAFFTDRLQSRLYFATSCGLWMTPDILNFSNTPRWFRITNSYDDVKALAVSVTGDTIYIAGNAKVTRISGLNAVPFDTFSVGQDSIITSRYPGYQQVTTQVTPSGRYIEGIDVDMHDPNHVLCAVAGFSNPGTPHVYVSHDAGATWTAIHNNLPNIPVYQCVIDAYDASHYILGTELGFWDSHDAGTTWVEQNGGIVVREPIYRLRQQNYLSDQCYVLYAGTHGRGMWRCTTITEAQAGCTVVPLGINEHSAGQPIEHMMVYPNPMSGNGKVMIELEQASDMTLRIIDMTGRVLQESSNKHLAEGKNTFELNTASLANGSYLLVAKMASGQTYARKLVVSN